MRIRLSNQENILALNSIQMRPASCHSWSQLNSPAATAIHFASYRPDTKSHINLTTIFMI